MSLSYVTSGMTLFRKGFLKGAITNSCGTSWSLIMKLRRRDIDKKEKSCQSIVFSNSGRSESESKGIWVN